MDSVVHFEIPVDDDARAQAFYSDVFGWDIRSFPEMNYTMATTGDSTDEGMPTQPGRINGGMYHREEGLPSGPVVTISVEDLDAALARVRDGGGRVVRDRFEVADMGVGAYVADTEDNVIGLWQDLAPSTSSS
jgi:predicted enzyme related to lactoylglutathione lyase